MGSRYIRLRKVDIMADPSIGATGANPIPSFAPINTNPTTRATGTQTTTGAPKTTDTAKAESNSGKTVKQLEDEIKKLQSEKGLNYKKMEKIEAQIKEQIEKVKEGMKEAKKLQEQAIADHEAEAENAVDNCMAEYIAANKDGGKGMSKDELKANISKAMPDSPNLAKALGEYLTASRELAEVDSLLGTLNNLVIDTNIIESDISTKESALADAKKAEAAAAAARSSSSGSCDPIGFMKDGARYDFIVDDRSFDSTSDFLGADNNWASMEALDKDGDRVINASELKEAGIKMVKTVNGQRQIVDVAKEFGEDFKVDLNSYKQGGSFDGIDTTKDTDGDGTVDQQLLGTYTIHIGDEDIQGYNTLDDTDYLMSEYGLKNSDKSTGKAADYSAELKTHSNFFEQQSEISGKLSKELDEGYNSMGLTEATISQIKDQAKKEGQNDANIFMKEVEKQAKEEQKAEDAKKAEEEKKAEEAKKAEEDKKAEADKATGAENAKNTGTSQQKAYDDAKAALTKARAENKDDKTIGDLAKTFMETGKALGMSEEELKKAYEETAPKQ